jgi:hypothetical protein
MCIMEHNAEDHTPKMLDLLDNVYQSFNVYRTVLLCQDPTQATRLSKHLDAKLYGNTCLCTPLDMASLQQQQQQQQQLALQQQQQQQQPLLPPRLMVMPWNLLLPSHDAQQPLDSRFYDGVNVCICSDQQVLLEALRHVNLKALLPDLELILHL